MPAGALAAGADAPVPVLLLLVGLELEQAANGTTSARPVAAAARVERFMIDPFAI